MAMLLYVSARVAKFHFINSLIAASPMKMLYSALVSYTDLQPADAVNPCIKLLAFFCTVNTMTQHAGYDH